MNPEIDLYGVIGEIRDAVDALLKRGKPASVADLQALVAQVEAKSRPTITLPAKEVAALLVPELLPLLPTPATLAQAGKDAAVRMEAAIKAGTVVSVQQVAASMQQLLATMQESARQTTAAAAEYRAATTAAPRSIPVDIKQGWRWVAGLVLVPLASLLLGQAVLGQFSKVSKEDYEQLQVQQQQWQAKAQQLQAQNASLNKTNRQLGATAVRYEKQIKRYRGKHPKTTDFPAY